MFGTMPNIVSKATNTNLPLTKPFERVSVRNSRPTTRRRRPQTIATTTVRPPQTPYFREWGAPYWYQTGAQSTNLPRPNYYQYPYFDRPQYYQRPQPLAQSQQPFYYNQQQQQQYYNQQYYNNYYPQQRLYRRHADKFDKPTIDN